MINKILVFGAGYVGASLSVLLAQNYEVALIDVDPLKIKKINNKEAPINEPLLQEFLLNDDINLSASSSYNSHLESTDLIILALPTDYNAESNSFDTSIIESVISDLNDLGTKAAIVIKSTVPIGFTDKMNEIFPNLSLAFVPEFLREGKAIEDNINPSRIVIGSTEKIKELQMLGNVFSSIADNTPQVIYMNPSEAEAVKLFSNAYLATRISFFNELDSYALKQNLNTKQIIDGVTSDPRIGSGYHNPSFGYGGYCLPKDTKQLLANFENLPQAIFSATVKSNELRKNFIAQMVLIQNPQTIGIYRLIMKKDSSNFRESSVFDLMKLFQDAEREIVVFEPLLPLDYEVFTVTHDLNDFKEISDIILANRLDDALKDVQDKVFSRDIYDEN